MQKQYLRLAKVEGPLIMLEGVDDVSYDEILQIDLSDGQKRPK